MNQDATEKILCIGAHFDDIELNCLGTILRLINDGSQVYLVVCTSGEAGGNPKARRIEQNVVNKLVGYKQVFYLHKPDGFLKQDAKLIKELEEIVDKVKPDMVLTHSEDDFHQDHVVVSKAVRAVNRYSHFSTFCFPSQDVKQPFFANLYIDISDYFEKKLEILKEFKSQLSKPWLSDEWITARNLGIDDFKHTEKFNIRFLKL